MRLRAERADRRGAEAGNGLARSGQEGRLHWREAWGGAAFLGKKKGLAAVGEEGTVGEREAQKLLPGVARLGEEEVVHVDDDAVAGAVEAAEVEAATEAVEELVHGHAEGVFDDVPFRDVDDDPRDLQREIAPV